MNIAVVSWAGCTRCMKESKIAAEAGNNLWFFNNFQPQISKRVNLDEVFTHITVYNHPQVLYNLLNGLDFIDIVHVHNEPSWMVNVAQQAGHNKIVFDAHDLGVVRNGWENLNDAGREDLAAIGQSQGLIVPCEKYIEILEERGKMSIPWIVMYSYCSEKDFVPNPTHDLGGVVYEGSIYAPAPNHPFPYRIYDNVAKQIVGANIPFYIYPSRGYERGMPYYQSLGCRTMPSTDPGTLIENLSRHKWGFVGSPVPHRQWNNTLSNKLFDYIAAGIPSFIYNAKATEDLFGNEGVGIVIKHLFEVEKYYNDEVLYKELQDNIMKVRSKWTMESQTAKLMEFYNKVLED